MTLSEKKLYLGIWDNTDSYGNSSEYGGIIQGKDSLGFYKKHGLLFKMKILNEPIHEVVSAYSNAITAFDIYPENDKKTTLAESLKRFVFLFKVDGANTANPSVISVRKIPQYSSLSSDYQLIPIIYSSSEIPNINTFKHYLHAERKIPYGYGLEIGDGDSTNGFVIFYDTNSGEHFLCENAELKEADIAYMKFGLYDSEDNEITVRKIKQQSWSDGKYFDNDDEPNLVFIPADELRVGNIEDYAPKYEAEDSYTPVPTPVKETVPVKPVAKPKIVEPETMKNTLKNNEDIKIITRFNQVIQSKQYALTLEPADLLNLHTSVKTNLLTILSGISGTGKSQIVNAYAAALGIKNEKQFKIIPVRPFWADDSDLLGYVDSSSNTYHPGDSGLIDILAAAEKDPDNLYLVLLDEMNLAKIEHYFSQFLSILELPAGERKLRLYNPALALKLYNGNEFNYEISIGNNVRFVGTMNIDESAYQMSNKLLDRANIINLSVQKFSNRHIETLATDPAELAESKITTANYTINNEENLFSQSELDFFWNLHLLINQALPDVGIGWRTLNSIERFISNLPDNIKDFDGLDYQVAQRILPRLRGTESMLESLIHLDEKEQLQGSVYQLLKEYGTLSDFKQSLKVLTKKAKEIKIYGFAR